ncbi:MAG TPA: phosphoribosylanthranilate isomerase [Desulfitobacteriaceae bacterium]|nr:phosphoribosylanthranilate isomerase [Desulfitobacteriaceae bacterium]
MIHVKICGIKSLEEALWSAEAGADALGFILVPASKRYIEPSLIREISAQLPPYIARIGVFVNTPPSEVKELAERCGLTGIQLHGEENPENYRQIALPLIKALRVPAEATETSPKGKSGSGNIGDWRGLVQGLLVDSVVAGQFGGTGFSLPWNDAASQNLFAEIRSAGIPLILAGGLTLDNIEEGIRIVKPYAVDVSSGVERDGRKAAALIKEFIRKAKAAG